MTSTDSGCVPEWGEHANYSDTGQRGINELTGSTYEVWVCECGEQTLDRFPMGQAGGVAMQTFCPDCQGNGQVWHEHGHYIACGTCGRMGVIWVDPYSETNYQTYCPTCSGSRSSSDGDDCPSCVGRGVIDVFGTAGRDDEGVE